MIYKFQNSGVFPKIIRLARKLSIPEKSIVKIAEYNPKLIKHPKTIQSLYNIGLDNWTTSGYYNILEENIKLDPVFAAGLHLPEVKSILGENPLFFWRAESPLGPQLKTSHGALFGSTLSNASTYVKPLNFDVLKETLEKFREMRYKLNADNVFDYYPNFVEIVKNKNTIGNENALGFYVTNGDNVRILDAEKTGWHKLKGHFPEIELEYKDLFGSEIPEQTLRKWNNPERLFTTDNIAKLATKTGTTYVIKNVGDPGYYSLLEDPGRYTTEIIVPLGQPVKSVLNSSFNWNPVEFGNTFKIFKKGGIIKAQGGLGKAAKSIFKAVRSAEKPVIKLVEPLKLNTDIKLLQQNIFKEAIKRAGPPVLGSIGESPLGGSELFKAMLNGTYVAPPPHTYGGLKLNPNYYYRRGWGIIDDALDIGVIRVPESGYIEKALKKYPWLDNGNPFSTTLIGQSFPYFSEGKFWPTGGKFGVEPEDLIAIPKGLPWVNWVAGSKYGGLKPYNKPSEFGGRATPLIDGQTNSFPTEHSLLFKLDSNTREYVPFKKLGGIIKD